MDEPQILIGLDYSIASKNVIEILIETAEDTDTFEEIAKANIKRPEILQLLFEYPETPESVKTLIAGFLHLPARTSTDLARMKGTSEVTVKRPPEFHTQNIFQKIQMLSVSERVQLAMKGNREVRGILIKDTNKEVVLSVLSNQKITDTEIELIARSRSVHEEAFRKIARNRCRGPE